jgi:hypothetical protein
VNTVRVLLLGLAAIAGSYLARFLFRALRKTLRTGVAGTMQGRTYRRTTPRRYWLLVAWNIAFIVMSVAFILLVLVVATGYLRM